MTSRLLCWDRAPHKVEQDSVVRSTGNPGRRKVCGAVAVTLEPDMCLSLRDEKKVLEDKRLETERKIAAVRNRTKVA